MSSNGARAARKLRGETAALLAESEASFRAKFGKFKGVVRQSKATVALTHHQHAWKKDGLTLAKQRKTLESEIATLLAGIATEAEKSATDGDAEWRQLPETRASLQAATHATARELQASVRRAQAMLKAAKMQKLQEQMQTRIQPSKHLFAPPPKKAVTFVSEVPPPPLLPGDTTNNKPASSPLASFLASIKDRMQIDDQMLAAEEQNLTQQLLLMQSTLDQYEQPIAIADDANAASPLQATEQKEMSEHEQTAIDDADSAEDAIAPMNRTFLTSTQALSPRTRRTHRSTTSLGTSAFPPLPDADPALLTLPSSELEKAHESRAEAWQEFADELARTIDARFEENIRNLRELFDADTAATRQAIETSDRESGWGPKHQQRMQSIQSSYKQQGAKRAQVLDRLRLEFTPEAKQLHATKGTAGGRDLFCLAERLDLSYRHRAYRIQRAALHTAWEAERAAFMDGARESLFAQDRTTAAAYERARAAEAQAAHQSVLHSELAVLRDEKAARDAEQAALDAERQREAAEEAAAKAARDAALREKQRALLDLYHAHQLAEAADAAAQAERARAAAAEEARHAIDMNRAKVDRRQDLLAERRAAQAQREAEQRAADRAREERLEAIRQLVAPNVQRDAARVLQATQASAAEGDPNHPLFAVHGYDMSALLKDKRFRIQLALWNAGVSHTSYAKEVVAMASPAVAPRPDMRSQVFPSRPT